MKSGVYIDTLRLGFENPTGISFDDIVKKLNIDLSDNSFKINYTIWFYLNFYNINNETSDNEFSIAKYQMNYIRLVDIERIPFNSTKSYIKGDAINKYIDFVELQNARKSSITATRISLISVAIAISSIIVSVLYPKNPKPPYEVIITNDRNNSTNSKFDHSLDCKFGIEEKDKVDNNQTNDSDTLGAINPK